jgi:hypothetical protein
VAVGTFVGRPLILMVLVSRPLWAAITQIPSAVRPIAWVVASFVARRRVEQGR